MIRIAINGRFMAQATTGVQRVAREFTKALDHLIDDGTLADVEARLLTPPGVDADMLALRRIGCKPVGRLRAHAWEQASLPAALDKDEILLNLGNTAPVACLLSSRRTALMIHDLSHRLFPDAYRARYRLPHSLFDRIVLSRADPIITVAETERAQIEAIMPSAAPRIVVAANGGWTDTGWMDRGSVGAAATPPGRDDGAPPYGLYVGSLSRRKNVHGVIAAAIALARSRGLPFRIVGASSPILSSFDTAIPSDVAPLISFCGQIEDSAQLKTLYRNAALLLFPSFYEASALPPIEAMGEGCPVIASHIQPLIERCGDAAIYCDPHDLSSIVAAVDRLLDQPGLADDLRARGHARAAMFTWKAQVQTVIAALRSPAGQYPQKDERHAA